MAFVMPVAFWDSDEEVKPQSTPLHPPEDYLSFPVFVAV
jgi:hypothetical protein